METEEVSEIVGNLRVTGEEAYQYLPHPGYFGNAFETGETVFGHTTLFEGSVIKTRLFKEKERAEDDFDDMPHPQALSVLFKATARDMSDEAEVDDALEFDDVEILNVKEPGVGRTTHEKHINN